jgi:hypothetical protein
MKANPWQLIRAHHRTFVAYPSGDRKIQDYALFWGLPLLIFIVCLALHATLPKGASTALLTTAGILTAFFFGVMLQVSQRSLEWAERGPEPGADTTWQAQFLQEIAANAGYASLISVVAAAIFVGALIATAEWLLVILSAAGLALAVHLALLVPMVLTRIYALTTDRLDEAQVGGSPGNVTHIHERKSGSG